MSIKISPFAPQKMKKINLIDGVNVSITHCGLKKNNKDDLVLIKFDKPSDIEGVFTNSKTPGEPIIWNKSIIKHGKVSAILINSGNANVFNGKSGRKSLINIVSSLEKILKVPRNEIYIASTGVIGVPLDEKKIIKKIPYLISNLKNDRDSWFLAAKAIMTTDTYPKIYSEAIKEKASMVINCIAKGSGMIAPNMATMLAFIFTNAEFKKKKFKKNFLDIVNKTFNSITVDGDTSTSDMVLFISVKNKSESSVSTNQKKLLLTLQNVMTEISEYIVKDGEGASKFIKISVEGAKKELDAKKVGYSVANSPLFKTAMAGSDANWGRIVMAVGKSGVDIDTKKLSIKFGKFTLLKNGEKFSSSNLKNIDKYLKKREIEMTINLGVGKKCWIIKTCDFTKKYISINTDYRS